MTTVTNAQEAVGVAASESVNAAYQKTFAVGGAIIDNATKKIIAAMHNNVLMPYPPASGTTRFLPHDPTAHGERQLVDWYYENAAALKLPPAQQLTVVTTLDPCAQVLYSPRGSMLPSAQSIPMRVLITTARLISPLCPSTYANKRKKAGLITLSHHPSAVLLQAAPRQSLPGRRLIRCCIA